VQVMKGREFSDGELFNQCAAIAYYAATVLL
jgi:hypothetical protein